ncbi:MAG: 4-diphosphocytidyl-2C-methyl-D-erythritol kinase [Proteobacteria bacterium]|nr:4-diphosphocytidyl-2C-methyl-D-erythritol kinase [Pseudomonadota bacterium]
MKQGGYHATVSGRVLESIVESSLTAKGLKALPFKAWDKNPQNHGTELLLKNVPYESIYKHSSKTEFLAMSSEFNILTRIECKWQQASGSVDEKFPFLFLNCTEKMLEPHVIILLDGGGAKQGAVDWLTNACDEFNQKEALKSMRRIDLMNTTGFLQWVNRAFK